MWIEHLVNSSFDNLMITLQSKETYKGVVIRLLAQGLVLDEPDSVSVGPLAFQHLQENVSAAVRKQVVVKGSYEKTLEKHNQLKLIKMPYIH